MAQELFTTKRLADSRPLGRDDLHNMIPLSEASILPLDTRSSAAVHETADFHPSTDFEDTTVDRPLGRDDLSNSSGYDEVLKAQASYEWVKDKTIRQSHDSLAPAPEAERQLAIGRMTELVTEAEFLLVTKSVVAVDLARLDISYPPDAQHIELLAKAAYAVYFEGSNISADTFMTEYKEEIVNQLADRQPDHVPEGLTDEVHPELRETGEVGSPWPARPIDEDDIAIDGLVAVRNNRHLVTAGV